MERLPSSALGQEVKGGICPKKLGKESVWTGMPVPTLVLLRAFFGGKKNQSKTKQSKPEEFCLAEATSLHRKQVKRHPCAVSTLRLATHQVME